jgi:hypothetical protein
MKTLKEFKKDNQIDEKFKHPNHKKLDKNKNGKLDKQDFELLRKGKEKSDCMEETGKPTSAFITTSKGTVKTKNDPFYPEYDKHEQGKTSEAKKKKFSELGLKAEGCDDKNASDSYSTTRGKVVKTKSGNFIATDKSGSTKSFDSKKDADDHAMKEEYDIELAEGILGNLFKSGDNQHQKLFNSYLKPEHQGKYKVSNAKGLKASYTKALLAGHLKEEFDIELAEAIEELELAELSKATLGSYINKSHNQLMKHTAAVNVKTGRGDPDAFAYSHEPNTMRKSANREKGISTAVKKLTKEETEGNTLAAVHVWKDKSGIPTGLTHQYITKHGTRENVDTPIHPDDDMRIHTNSIRHAVESGVKATTSDNTGRTVPIHTDNLEQHISDIHNKKGFDAAPAPAPMKPATPTTVGVKHPQSW